MVGLDVPQEMDDQKYADHVRFIRRTMQKKPEHITNYVIFTTTDCNARCFYCYELGRSRIPMSVETAHQGSRLHFSSLRRRKRQHPVVWWRAAV